MIMARKTTLLLLLCVLVKMSIAQEPHYSMFYQNPTMLNPALAGMNDCIFRVGGIYRDQWRTVSKPYRTYSFFADARLQPYEWRHDAFGVGLLFTGDKAGSANLSTNDFRIIGSYHKGLIDDNRLIISLGTYLGFVNHKLDKDALFFGNQWNGTSFDPALPNDELFSTTSTTYFDMGAGLMASIFFTDFTILNIGGSLRHITRPNYTFMGAENKLGMRTTLHLSFNAAVSMRATIMPKVYFSMQDGNKEAVMGFNVSYVARLEPMYMGVWYRWASDITPVVGFRIKGFDLFLAYDVSISRLNPVSKYHGGFEISLLKNLFCEDPFYKFDSHRKDGNKVCPVF
jgi:type IX secretion system PorP/SprF family membrane protein